MSEATVDELLTETPTPIEIAAETTPEPVKETVTETVSTEQFEASQQEADNILDMLMARIAPVGKATRRVKMMIYGDFGVGKTVFSATAPNPLVVAVEEGSMSLLNHPELRNTDVLEFRSVRQLELLLEKMHQDAEPLRKYETVVIDTFSELQKRDLDDIVRQAAATDASRNRFLPIGPDYNINTEHLRQIATQLRTLDRHVIILCHVKEEKDESTGRLLVRPNLTPKLAGTMAGMFDVVGYMARDFREGNEVRTLQVHPTPTVTAKTRIGGLDSVQVNPTFNTILKAFNSLNS